MRDESLLCSWCDDDATYLLVADVDSRDSAHAACDEHERQWGRLYRRSVSVAHRPAVDVRTVDVRAADVRNAGLSTGDVRATDARGSVA